MRAQHGRLEKKRTPLSGGCVGEQTTDDTAVGLAAIPLFNEYVRQKRITLAKK